MRSLKQTSCYSRFLLKNIIAVLIAALLLSCCPTETTKACISHLPASCGTTWIQRRRAGNSHEAMTCQLQIPVDFARHRFWDIQEGKKKYFKLFGCQELAVEISIKGVGVFTWSLPELGRTKQEQLNNKKLSWILLPPELLKVWLKHHNRDTCNFRGPGLFFWF